MNRLIKPTALALGLALASTAIAQTAPTPAQQKELDVARAELNKAAQRFAELQREYGGTDATMRIEKRLQRKPVIGVLLAPDDAAGVRIAGVTPDSAAAAAGLKSGDRITSIDGKAINAASGSARVEQTRELLAKTDAKTPVKLMYQRDGKPGTISVTPKIDQRVFVFNSTDGSLAKPGGNVFIRQGSDGQVDIEADSIEFEPGDLPPPGIAPEVHRDIILANRDCKGGDCKFPAFAEAFRWNGLNLATVDAQLGRYFGARDGVLVLSTGDDLEGLQAGDVIRKIGGKPVSNPREAMEALRAQPADAKVAVGYLRDRNSATVQISVPKVMPFAIPRIAAPRVPGMPGAIEHRKMIFVGEDGKVQTFEDGIGKAPPAWAPKDGKRVEKRKYVMVDKDGKRSEWEGDAGDTPPVWVQAMPKDGKRIEKRVQVIVDDQGNKTIIEDDELPSLPPPPPASPKGG